MRNRETDMFSREKRQIVSSLRVTFIYYNQYITSSTGLSFSLSLLNLIIVPAVSIKLLTLIALRFLYYNQHISSTESLSLSLFYKKSNHRARYRSNYTPLSTARFSNPCSFEFSPSSPHLPRILSTTPRISRRNLWLILSRFPRRR